MISCCAECPAFVKEDNLCGKEEISIGKGDPDPAAAVLLGFPEWCPLSDVKVAGDGLDAGFKKIARQILKRLDLDTDDDSVTLVSHYLSTVTDIKDFKGEKQKMESGGLFCRSVS
jgi:hypothetical protein